MRPARPRPAPRARQALAIVLLFATLPAGARAADAPAPMAETPAPPAAPAPPPSPLVTEPEHPPAPAPMTAAARAHYEEGLRFYGDRDFPAAIRELEVGFALEPRREFLFAEAQAYRLAGDCARAIPLYERFLGSGPSPLQVDATRLALDRCARQPVAAAPTAPAAPAPPPPAPPIPAPRAERPPWWHDPWALGALSAGVAATGVGIGFVIGARSAADQANGPTTTRYPDYDRLWDRAEQRQTIGLVSLAAGGALLAAGAARLVWLHRKAGRAGADGPPLHALSTMVVPISGGATLLQQVTF